MATSTDRTLGFGLGVAAQSPEGLLAAETLLDVEPSLLDYIEIYPGAGALPDAGGKQIDRWRDACVPMTLHTATLDLWSDQVANDRGLAIARQIEARIDPVWNTQDTMLMSSHSGSMLPAAIFTEEAVDATTRRYRECADSLSAPLLIENAPYQLTVGDLTLASFFQRLADSTGCGLTLDIGHVVGTAMLGHGTIDEMLEGYPFDNVIEIHVAGGRVSGDPARYVDDHDAELPDETLPLLGRILERCRSLRAVTYEVRSPVTETLRPRLERVSEVLTAAGFAAGQIPKGDKTLLAQP
jgi:uncharacterized protein (UPF0276 family)